MGPLAQHRSGEREVGTALRLKAGDTSAMGDSMCTAKCSWTRTGTVERVTPRGGIKLTDGTWTAYPKVIWARPGKSFAELAKLPWGELRRRMGVG
jgi:hypothetical protein